MEDAADENAQFERQEDETLALEMAETREETEQTNLAKDTEAADERENADVTITEHDIDETTDVIDEIMEMVAAEKVMPEPAATIATEDAQPEDAGMTAARSEVPEPTVTIAGDDQDVHFEEGVATEVEHYSGQETRQRVVPCDVSPAVVEQASVTSATLDEHKPVDIAMKPKTRSQPEGPQAANGTAPGNVSGEAIITAQSLAQPTHKPNELITPIVNPEAFPINRIQDIQALRYPLARITGVWAHRKTCGDVVQVTIDMQDGPVDHFIINDARLITAFGLREGNDFITVHEPYLRHMETFNIRIFPNQRVCSMKAFVVGEMVSARHAYLYWLEFRGSADPKGEPWVQEARRIATQIGRRALDVWKEIDGYWQLEHGSGGRMYRENRMKYLGEDPVIHENDLHEKKMTMSVWG
ncbi:hypothetical protein FB567DRAFT_515229 [Paraphoma chrysanthemicola]|uniref:Uncharacterized protein n=1 Tax=Paraphoma chrysanthemicola TaxID=798071 RepID=A0A8K0W3J4_9PLEO|nr:hypothetical protein FB567DRAFT_515229 [Paraphoma chrysanthemicola]